MVTKQETFDDLVLDSIDDALHTLGQTVPQSVYSYLETKYALQKTQIPKNLPQFQDSLEKLFGIGARYLEILMMKNLYRKIQRPLKMDETSQLEFVQYIKAARQSFLNHAP